MRVAYGHQATFGIRIEYQAPDTLSAVQSPQVVLRSSPNRRPLHRRQAAMEPLPAPAEPLVSECPTRKGPLYKPSSQQVFPGSEAADILKSEVSTAGSSGSSESGACSVIYSISSTWSASNGTQSASVNLYLQASGSSDINVPYTLSFSNSAWIGLVNNWNFEVTFRSSWSNNVSCISKCRLKGVLVSRRNSVCLSCRPTAFPVVLCLAQSVGPMPGRACWPTRRTLSILGS